MLFVRRNLFGKSLLVRPFAKKVRSKVVTLEERDEYDLETAYKLMKAGALAPIDESVDLLIRYASFDLLNWAS